MEQRSQADRDAITIEIVFAFVSGLFAAGLAFAVLYVPVLAFDLSPTADRTLTMVGGALAATAFLLRVAQVLWRFAHRPQNEGREGLGRS
ncbi:DUF6332 family protein [Streptomyces sp. NBC_00335]|uniref:DUF6332 family protein n=1 Tax=unclassified Streptomyces TaxID=2593676 RepID=UPI002259DF93|nr:MULTISPECIES: DUF6332 family protein [unclassified Streptomyces]MCX5408953.1 DUF6332 family protein [Streptomyces sp. NBC_00086]